MAVELSTLRDLRAEISRVNSAAGYTVFNPALTLAVESAIAAESHKEVPNREKWLELAREKWEDEGELEIDDDARVSLSEAVGEPAGTLAGAYVSAWVWVEATDELGRAQ
jgi:predicted sugar kinase